MTTVEALTTRPRTTGRALVVLTATATAVLVNLLAFTLGRLAGGDFTFSRNGTTVAVDALTVAGFSAVPLGAGLVVVALTAPRIPWVTRVAVVLAPVLAVATIAVMTLPVDLDTVSTLALASCHLTLVPISVVAIRRLRP